MILILQQHFPSETSPNSQSFLANQIYNNQCIDAQRTNFLPDKVIQNLQSYSPYRNAAKLTNTLISKKNTGKEVTKKTSGISSVRKIQITNIPLLQLERRKKINAELSKNSRYKRKQREKDKHEYLTQLCKIKMEKEKKIQELEKDLENRKIELAEKSRRLLPELRINIDEFPRKTF